MQDFPELMAVEQLARTPELMLRTEIIAEISSGNRTFPIIAMTIGSQDRNAPCFGLFGGVHGLERVGSQVVISYLDSLLNQLTWDRNLRQVLERTRVLAIPIINPAGMYAFTRCNPNGVDLLRQEPIDADPNELTFLISGHRISKYLPWFRGYEGMPMEVESRALIDFARENIFPAASSITLDLHSGFGIRDRLWYPYAKSSENFPNLKNVEHLATMLNRSIPHHVYKIERQTDAYTISGDLWDYIHLLQQESPEHRGNIFVPWTLEMGSWLWLKKNPRQLLTRRGYFNPIKTHRQCRIMRRHLLLIDFFRRATCNAESWT